MDSNYSLTIKSLFVGAVVLIAPYVGHAFTTGELQTWLDTTGKLISTGVSIFTMALAWYGRIRRGDLNVFGKRLSV